MTQLRFAFMGTPDFAAAILDALIAAGHDIAAVYCQPPRPAGRGHRLSPRRCSVARRRPGFRSATPNAARRRGGARIRGARSRCRGGRGLWPHPAEGGARRAAPRLPQCPCLAAAALARCGADRARDPRRRPRDRHHHHAHGRRSRYRPDPAGRALADPSGRNRRRPAPGSGGLGARLILEALDAIEDFGAEAAARRRRDLRQEDRARGRTHRLAASGRRARAPGARARLSGSRPRASASSCWPPSRPKAPPRPAPCSMPGRASPAAKARCGS